MVSQNNYINFWDKEFIENLEKAVKDGIHDTAKLGVGEFPECFIEHITKANNELNEPFTEAKLNEFTRSIKLFLYSMIQNRYLF